MKTSTLSRPKSRMEKTFIQPKHKTATEVELALRRIQDGAKVFTGLFWETVTGVLFDQNIMRNPYPVAVECGGHIVELHTISNVVLSS